MKRGVLHVRVVEQREGDRQHALALEVVDVLEAHRVDGLVVERVHGRHAPLQRVEDQVGHGIIPLAAMLRAPTLFCGMMNVN